jgi:hypothetical protein
LLDSGGSIGGLISATDVTQHGVAGTALVTTKQGTQFHNSEYLTIERGRIRKADVYFGATYRDGRFISKAQQ